MSGTDRSKQSVPEPQPVFVLVEPQMGENIGAAARGMLNFGLTAMRLVAPRDGWPNEKAGAMAAGASAVLDSARVFDDLAAAVGDCSYVMATTARPRDMRKPVFSPEDAAARLAEKVESGVRCAVLFGCERSGLSTEDVAHADAIITAPVNPGFASLNLAQAAFLIAYEWARARGLKQGFGDAYRDVPPAEKQELFGLFDQLEQALDGAGYFFPAAKRDVMARHLRTMLTRAELTRQEVQTLRGVVKALENGPRRRRNAS